VRLAVHPARADDPHGPVSRARQPRLDEVRRWLATRSHRDDRRAPVLGQRRCHAGVNTNVLTDDRAYDEASGTAVLFGTPVTVEPVTQSADG
jgi:hypothetical protein